MSEVHEQASPRETRDGPFAWVSKAALRRLADAYGESDGNALTSARSVYLALCTMASDRASERFQASKALIAHCSGASIRTVAVVIKRLQAVAIIDVERQSSTGAFPDAPNFYTLLGVGNHCLVILRQVVLG